MRISDWISYVCSSDLSDADLQGYYDMPPDQYEMLKAGYKASYAFRDKIDTDGFDHPKKIYDLAEELIRRGYSDANIQAVLGGNFRRLLGDTWKPIALPEKFSMGGEVDRKSTRLNSSH